jgi:esterase/lipase
MSDWLGAAHNEYSALRASHTSVALVGQSMGGALATLVAADHPELPALVLLAPYLSMMPRVSRIARRNRVVSLLVPYVRGGSQASIWDPGERASSLGYGVTPTGLLPQLARVTRAAWQAAPRVSSPTLMMQSITDNRIPLADAERVYERLGAPTKEFVRLEGCGHVIAVDYCRAQVFSRCEEWLARFVARAASSGGSKGI